MSIEQGTQQLSLLWRKNDARQLGAGRFFREASLAHGSE
jgi:hypothetical protein